MAYADITINDPNRVKRWVQRRRFRDAVNILRNAETRGTVDVLDFGGGDGELLRQCLLEYPSIRACLYEPTAALRREAEAKLAQHDRVRVVADLESLGDRRFDFVFCLEVFEHLPQPATHNAIDTIHRLLKPRGVAIIGVPHEVFLPALAKGVFRMIRRFGAFDARPLNVLNAALGRPPACRPTREIAPGFAYHHYHLGFDHRQLERELKNKFQIISRWFSPAKVLGPVLNSEVYYLLRPVAG
jgi:SAM-dependent methyltransferase